MDEDLKLIERYRSGDENAIEVLVMKYQKKVYSLAYRVTGNVEDAQDMTQKAFLQVFLNIRKFRMRSSFYTWLYRITVNTCLNHLRRKNDKTVELGETLAGNNSEALSLLIAKEKQTTVKSTLSLLPDRQRTAVILRAYDGLSLKETAEVMNCSEGAVKAHYHNGIEKLKKVFTGKGSRKGV